MKTAKVQNAKLHPQLKKLDGKLRQAAEMYEKQFLRQMVKAMRNSVSHSSLTKPGMAENIYREQLDDKYVENWVDRGGTGFAEMVYKELVDKFYPQLGIQQPKKVRPINISDRYQGISKAKTDVDQKKQTFNISLKPQEGEMSFLKIPWEAKFNKAFELANGDQVAEFSHPNGLKSVFAFKGKLNTGLLNKSLSKGENFAQLSPEAQSLTWQIKAENSRKDPAVEESKRFIK